MYDQCISLCIIMVRTYTLIVYPKIIIIADGTISYII